MTFDVFIIHEISLYLYKYVCIVLIHCTSCTASRHRSRLRRQTLNINLLGIISEWRNNALNLMKTSGADLTCSTLIPTPRRRRVVLFSQQWHQSYAGMRVQRIEKFRGSLRWIVIHKQSNCLGSLSYFPIFLGKLELFCQFFGKKMLFWHRTFAVVLGIRLIRRRWKGCRFWDVPFTVCCGFSTLDTGSFCHSSSSVIALLVVWSDHLSVCKDLRSFVDASDKFRRSLRWIAIHKKSNCLGWLSYFPIFLGKLNLFCHFFGNNRGFGWLFLLFHGYNHFNKEIQSDGCKVAQPQRIRWGHFVFGK